MIKTNTANMFIPDNWDWLSKQQWQSNVFTNTMKSSHGRYGAFGLNNLSKANTKHMLFANTVLDEIIGSLHEILEKPSRSTTKLQDVAGQLIQCQAFQSDQTSN